MRAYVIDQIGTPIYETKISELCLLLGKTPSEVEEMEVYWIDYILEYNMATKERDYKRQQLNKALKT